MADYNKILSPEEIEREVAKAELHQEISSKSNEKLLKAQTEQERIATTKKEADERAEERRRELNRPIDSEDEAMDLSKENRKISFLISFGLAALVGLLYAHYLMVLGGHSPNPIMHPIQFFQIAFTTKNIMALYALAHTSAGQVALAYTIGWFLAIPTIIYGMMPMFGKIIRSIFSEKVSEGYFMMRIANAFADVYQNLDVINTKRVKKTMELQRTKRPKKKFLSMWYGYLFSDFIGALAKWYSDSKKEVARHIAGDENSNLIDAMLRNLKLYAIDRASGVQGRNADGQFDGIETYTIYPELKGIPKEGEYVYSFPTAYNIQNLKESLDMFKQEFRKRNLGVNIKCPADCSAIYFTVYPIIDLKSPEAFFNWHEAVTLFNSKNPLEIPVGVDEMGNLVYIPSIADFPHAMLAGGTGSGKSIGEGTTVLGYVYRNSPEEFAIALSDPHLSPLSAALKDSVFNYFRGRVFREPQESLALVRALVHEMEYRIGIFGDIESVTTIAQYNAVASSMSKPKFRRIVAFFEEWSAFYSQLSRDDVNELNMLVSRIAKEGRKFGIHLFVIEQNPIAEALPTAIKNQMPIRICMRMESQSTSDVVLGGKVNGETADKIPKEAKGYSLMKGIGAMKFLAIPETDSELPGKRQFNSLREFITHIEQRHSIGTAVPEEYIESITHIPDEDRTPLGLVKTPPEELQAQQAYSDKAGEMLQLFAGIKTYCSESGVELSNWEMAVIAFAFTNGSVAQQSWNAELGEKFNVGRNEFQKNVSGLVGTALKRVDDGPYKKTVPMHEDIKITIDWLIQYRKNEQSSPQIPTA